MTRKRNEFYMANNYKYVCENIFYSAQLGQNRQRKE